MCLLLIVALLSLTSEIQAATAQTVTVQSVWMAPPLTGTPATDLMLSYPGRCAVSCSGSSGDTLCKLTVQAPDLNTAAAAMLAWHQSSDGIDWTLVTQPHIVLSSTNTTVVGMASTSHTDLSSTLISCMLVALLAGGIV